MPAPSRKRPLDDMEQQQQQDKPAVPMDWRKPQPQNKRNMPEWYALVVFLPAARAPASISTQLLAATACCSEPVLCRVRVVDCFEKDEMADVSERLCKRKYLREGVVPEVGMGLYLQVRLCV